MERWLGRSLRRLEDHRFLTGAGRYLDDIRLPGMLHAAFLRSPHAHARFELRGLPGGDRAGEAQRAERAARPETSGGSGSAMVWSWREIEQDLRAPVPPVSRAPERLAEAVAAEIRTPEQWPLARGIARYVGEPLAMALAGSRYEAEDLLEKIEVSYEPLPAVTDAEAALEEGAVLIHEELGSNRFVRFVAAKGDVDAAFAQASCIIRGRFKMHRHGGFPMECRGVLAAPDGTGGLTVWSSTQFPHVLRGAIAAALGLPAFRLRVIAPDIGGGFGPKVNIYPEEILIPLASLRLQRPVKWVEDRREHFLATTHAREQLHEAEAAFTADGRILGLRDRFIIDNGAYNPWGMVVPYNTTAHLPGPYHIPAMQVEALAAATNKTPAAPYRGAGRPSAAFVMDRLLDRAAAELGLDPAEIRRRNLIPSEAMPYDTGLLYRDGAPMIYDSGDYPACLEKALERIGYDRFRKLQAEERGRGRCLGIGLSAYVEGTGLGPFETARVQIEPSGEVLVFSGSVPQGQGHQTTLAQICADALGVEPAQIRVVTGDTGLLPHGRGSYASRSAVAAGNAVWQAAGEVRRKVLSWAAELLEAPPSDLVLEGGRVFAAERPDRAVTLAELAAFAQPGGAPGAGIQAEMGRARYEGRNVRRPEGVEAGLEAVVHYEPETVTYANAVHAAVVEVDPETGAVKVLDYVVAHDCGTVINPMIADGQVVGGVAQGIGGAVYEELVYDDQGQLLTGTFMDYHLPSSAELPPIHVEHLESPSPLNPLGVKGLGEGGAISPAAAIANAVEDALRPWSVIVERMPVTPERVRSWIRAASTGE